MVKSGVVGVSVEMRWVLDFVLLVLPRGDVGQGASLLHEFVHGGQLE